jgi:hypothetical protein
VVPLLLFIIFAMRQPNKQRLRLARFSDTAKKRKVPKPKPGLFGFDNQAKMEVLQMEERQMSTTTWCR